MTTRMALHSLQALGVGVVLHACLAFQAAASSLQLVSTVEPELGAASVAGGDSMAPIISRDGRFILFASTADNLVTLSTNRPLPALTPAPINVFLRDRLKGSTTLVSVNVDGSGGGNADSWPAGISTNGRYALFESSASNLVLNDTNNADDIFVRDLQTGATLLISIATNGASADQSSAGSVISPDGRFVAFASLADNLVPGDTNAIADVFLRDLTSNSTSLISVGAEPGPDPYLPGGCRCLPNGIDSGFPLLTPDGRYVAFYSTAANLGPAVQTSGEVYLRDRASGATIWVSRGALSAVQALAPITNTVSFNYVVSDNGRFVAFEATAYPQTSLGVILLYDTQTDHTDVIETNAVVPAISNFEAVQSLAMTPDGRFVAYVANLDDTGDTTAIRLWDAQTRSNILVSVNMSSGSVSDFSLSDSPAIDDSGRFITFISDAPDLVTNNLPGDFHLYVRDLQAGTTSLIDVDTNGAGSPFDPSSYPAMSADGRFLAFDSQDGSLVPSDRNRSYDIFVRDLTSAATELVSAHDPGLPSFSADGISSLSLSSVTSDARLIAFWSEADDLVSNDTNAQPDIFVHDTLTGTNMLVSVGLNGMAADGSSTDPAISPDGRYVAFTSQADNLVPGDTNRDNDVFVRDLLTGSTTLVSVSTNGVNSGNRLSDSPRLSTNGRIVLFHSTASDLAPGIRTVPIADNLFWRDLITKHTYALTTNQFGANVTATMTPDGSLVAFVAGTSTFPVVPGYLMLWDAASASIVYSLTGGPTTFTQVALSPDGQKLVYVTNASATSGEFRVLDRALNTNWVLAPYTSHSTSPPRFSDDSRFMAYVTSFGSGPYTNQLFLYDFQTGTNLLVSHGNDGVSPGNGDSDSPDISPDGRSVAYRSAADNLVPGDTNAVPDIFLYDRLTGSTTLVTASRFGGSANNRSLTPVFSGDSRTLLFDSWASDLVGGDFNNSADIYALSLSDIGSAPDFKAVVVSRPGPQSAICRLSWPATPGKSYRLQFKNNLSDSTWQELGSQVTVIGTQAYSQDAAPQATRFYRVVAW